MKIEVYSMLYNEERILNWMLDHYSFADKITLIDGFSTDKSLEICKGFSNVEVKQVNSNGKLNDDLHKDLKNNIWKGSDADWVIVIDTDELIYHPFLLTSLEYYKDAGYSIIKSKGYDMVSEFMPEYDGTKHITDICREGLYNPMYSKCAIFNPKKIEEINYSAGAHTVNPRGDVKTVAAFQLLHYRWTNWAKLLEIQDHRNERSKENQNKGFGVQLGWSKEELLNVLKDADKRKQFISTNESPLWLI